MVKWNGIQHALEEAESDILLLYDCCASGTANTDIGRGVTELIAACGFNTSANPVEPDSFTRALITELGLMSHMPAFTVGMLYNKLLCRTQNWMPLGREMQKPPLHVVLTQNRKLPQSIQLSPLRVSEDAHDEKHSPPSDDKNQADDQEPEDDSANLGDVNLSSYPALSSTTSSLSSIRSNTLTRSSTSSSFATQESDRETYPRIAITIRLKETLTLSDFSLDIFSDWVRLMPVLAEHVKIEAGFASCSTLLVISLPIPVWCYLGEDPAISALGFMKSSILVPGVPFPPNTPASTMDTQEMPLASQQKRPDEDKSQSVHIPPRLILSHPVTEVDAAASNRSTDNLYELRGENLGMIIEKPVQDPIREGTHENKSGTSFGWLAFPRLSRTSPHFAYRGSSPYLGSSPRSTISVTSGPISSSRSGTISSGSSIPQSLPLIPSLSTSKNTSQKRSSPARDNESALAANRQNLFINPTLATRPPRPGEPKNSPSTLAEVVAQSLKSISGHEILVHEWTLKFAELFPWIFGLAKALSEDKGRASAKENLKPTPASLGWAKGPGYVRLYQLTFGNEEPFLTLDPRWEGSAETPPVVYFDPPRYSRSHHNTVLSC